MFKLLNLIPKVKNIVQSDLGLTNQNYVVTLESGEQLFVRVPYPHNHKLFDYALESKVHQLIDNKNINLPYLFLDEESGIKISPYIENINHLDELEPSKVLPLIANKLRQLHTCPRVHVEFDIVGKYNKFKDLNTKPFINLTPYEYILNELSIFQERVLCHNDLVNGNVIEVKNQLYLIDYEYACDNHPYFDLLSLITENNIDDPILKQLFFESYFKRELTSKEKEDLRLFESIHDLLWCQWAQMQYSILKQPIYKEIAHQKFNQLKKMIQE